MKYFVKIITVTLILLGLTACEDRLDIQTNFPFEVKTMPVPKDIQQGQTVEIRCQIVSEQKYKYETYTLRYFQFESNGRLKLANQEPFLPNDTYVIPNRTFRLYYTSLSNNTQSFEVWIADGKGKEQKLNFEFNAKKEEGTE
ncbi:DUF3872 domain-containing protein [Ornithobacterium rhinotracheale]|uniref:DUF3872 domain-containing protein n=1 Tax=Ornithobacterium rhinotracheale (strain ATCC 51463 / DSM 15997 / CCUG 23171 / CIP 104009 / LMG 9086) TaxID=867902 RepID=I4A2H7_ORNRL|nr:DUF3872 domain-containing protein [Ornithobacterium rhinotracheale]AFL98161.1 hypothetical protein Ornrh_2026 [Ornithobacterium rhinotracheale DSM 15997]AIP99913.1 conjugal transfer protein TraQ [Ornithobacterium rhinotracheale ORT-UMN 88]KGB66084.1 conjugal transfer protein TraQ [Ornithobacterium rhinotracheale H06-030791]MBN3661781.1 DUF3872 domain-containing protein [Ornithobacterium rhinotracheale]MCK0193538.1 DUF3872 domain-containing protein [Ornithobacterium rhinotracheale]